ncbi:MAG: hypothetical protein LBN34_03260 [Clostridiales Family XIII bacterium]|nr:hypothetical protein [Clostridiales Family XIII bacterium]
MSTITMVDRETGMLVTVPRSKAKEVESKKLLTNIQLQEPQQKENSTNRKRVFEDIQTTTEKDLARLSKILPEESAKILMKKYPMNLSKKQS